MHEEITVFESLDSTNNYAMQHIHAGLAAHEDIFLALQQTAGKGQHGKSWLAEKGESILMSKVLRILGMETQNLLSNPIIIENQFQLSAMIALSVRDWFAGHAGNNVFIKWPNDIYYNDKKAGGILIENILKGNNWKWAIAGIGININQNTFPEILANPVSLGQITGKKYDVVQLANELNGFLKKYWTLWLNNGWKEIFNSYNHHLYKKGEQVRLRKENIVIPCTIKGVSENGKLLIEEDNAISFSVGEVAFENLGRN